MLDLSNSGGAQMVKPIIVVDHPVAALVPHWASVYNNLEISRKGIHVLLMVYKRWIVAAITYMKCQLNGLYTKTKRGRNQDQIKGVKRVYFYLFYIAALW